MNILREGYWCKKPLLLCIWGVCWQCPIIKLFFAEVVSASVFYYWVEVYFILGQYLKVHYGQAIILNDESLFLPHVNLLPNFQILTFTHNYLCTPYRFQEWIMSSKTFTKTLLWNCCFISLVIDGKWQLE
jgi:hypothetical protein